MKPQSQKHNERDSVNDNNSASVKTQHSAAAIDQSDSLKSEAAQQFSSRAAHKSWMNKISARSIAQTISADELTSLSALIAFAAHKTGASEFRIERDLADRFNVANVKCLPAARFDDALRYLVDQVPA